MHRGSFCEWIPILPLPVWPLAGQCLLGQNVVVGSMTLLLAVRGNIATRSMPGPPFALQLHRTTVWCRATDPPLTRPFLVALRHLRWLSYAILVLGLLSAVVLYVTASPPPQHPLGYDPFASKKYVRDLEIYGGKINVIAVKLRQSLHKLWQD